MKFFSNVLGTFLTEILVVGLNFGLGVLVARLLPAYERGLLALAMLLPVTLAYFVDIGVSQSIVYQITRRKLPVGLVLGNSLLWAGVFWAAAAALIWLARDWLLGSFLQDLSVEYLVFAILMLPFLLVDAYLLSVLRGLQRFGLFNLRRLLSALILVAGVAILVGLAGLGVPGAMAAFLISTLFSIVLAAGMVIRLSHEPLRLDQKVAREALSFGAKSYVQNLAGHLHYRLDVYLLALFLPPTDVAFYTVATSVAEFIFYIPDSVGTVLFPRLSLEGEQRVHLLTAEVTRHTLLVTLVATVGLLLVGWWAIPWIYGPDYRNSIGPFLWLMPGMLAMAVYKVLTRNFTSRNRQQFPVLATGLGVGLNVALNLLLIPRLGVIGAAVASFLSYTVLAGVLLAFFVRESGLPIQQVLVFNRADLRRWGSAFEEVQKLIVRRLPARPVETPEQVDLK